MENILLDRYKILHQLGSGGFGETFLAEDLQTPSHKKVVIKSLKPVSHEATAEIIEKLFLKEASVLEDLGSQSSQIPTLYAYLCHDNHYYLVQEYIEGKNLAQLGVISSEQCFSILSSLLNTLKYIHSQNIIHRDIKPENIIIRDSDRLPVLIDFGAVKETMGAMIVSSGSAVSSVVVGTRAFMPPEQTTGRAVFSSDLYSLGLTMIYALTGKLPMELPSSNITGELDWQSYIPNLDSRLKVVLEKAIKMDIPSRYPTSEKMYEALHLSSLEEPSITRIIDLEKPSQSITPTVILPVTTSSTNSTTPTNVTVQENKNGLPPNFLTILVTSILVAIGVSAGFLIVQQMNQAQQEKERLEELLADEKEKNEEEAKKIAEAESLRAEAERNRLESEKLRQEAEARASRTPKTVIVPVRPSYQPRPSTTNSSSTNARVGGKTGSKNIRSGAGTNYPVVGSVYTGDSIQIIGSGRDSGSYLWYKVYDPKSGTTGWLAAQLVDSY